MSVYSTSSKINGGWLFPPMGTASSGVHIGPGFDVLVAAVLQYPL